MRDIAVIKDPEVAKLFADEARRAILHNLKLQEMTAMQLSKALGKPPSSIAHHVNCLKKAGLVEATRTEHKRNLVETYYRTTARNFVISYSLGEQASVDAKEVTQWELESVEKGLKGLKAFGYDLPAEELPRLTDTAYSLVKTRRKVYEEIAEEQMMPTGLEDRAFKVTMDLLYHTKLLAHPEYKRLVEDLAGELKKFRKGRKG